MQSKDDPKRNQPADEGRDNDPNIRDESAFQPGMNTVSSSDYDDENEKLTRTAADDFRKDTAGDQNADRSFDDPSDE